MIDMPAATGIPAERASFARRRKLLLAVPHNDIRRVLDYPDDLKFRSSMTLFAAVGPDEPLFEQALEKYFQGERDPATIELLQQFEG